MKLVTASFLASATLLDSLLTMPCTRSMQREKIILSMPQCIVSLKRVFRVQTCVSGWLV